MFAVPFILKLTYSTKLFYSASCRGKRYYNNS